MLIQEVTRRVNLSGIYQAIYTAGIKLPHPVCTALYYHRPLNFEKLLKCGFCGPSQKVDDNIFEVDGPTNKLTPMTPEDISQVSQKLAEFLAKFEIRPEFSVESVAHLLGCREGVVHSYVRKEGNDIVDFVSFYSVPTTVLGSDETINVAYLFYYFSNNSDSLRSLILECLQVCRSLDFDVFNALDIMDNDQFFGELGFISGDGKLNYYLFNWKTTAIEPKANGFLLF